MARKPPMMIRLPDQQANQLSQNAASQQQSMNRLLVPAVTLF